MSTRPALLTLVLALTVAPALAQSDAEGSLTHAPAVAEEGRAVADAAPVSILVVRRAAPADAPAPERPAQMETPHQYGIGLGGTWLAYGLSGTYDVNDTITAEAILGVFGRLTSVGGRAWYRFDQKETYDLYAYAGASVYRYGISGFSENAFGAGGGVGIEASLRELFDNEDFPPIYVSADVGLGVASFSVYGFSAFSAGSGIHYRF